MFGTLGTHGNTGGYAQVANGTQVAHYKGMTNDTKQPRISYIEDTRTHRIRVRCIDVEALATHLVRLAITKGGPVCDADHGGSVANSYGYAAQTEGAVLVAFPSGQVAVWAAQLPANKVTLSGVASATAGYAYCWDGRVGDAKREAAKAALYHHAAHLLGEPHDSAVCVEEALSQAQ